MKTAQEYYEMLILIDEAITSYYNKLEELECSGLQNSTEYNQVFADLYDEAAKENSILLEVEKYNLLPQVRELLDKDLASKFPSPITLRHANPHFFRLNNFIETMYKNETLQYAYALKYDIGYLLFAIIEELVQDDYYSDIRSDLIGLKYSIIFDHVDIENDFLENKINPKDIRLTSYQYRASNPGHRYIDKAVLIEECSSSLIYLENVDEFTHSSIKRCNVIIAIMNILVRLILCDEVVMNSLYKELMNILDNESYPQELKAEIQNMFNILEIIQDRLKIART